MPCFNQTIQHIGISLATAAGIARLKIIHPAQQPFMLSTDVKKGYKAKCFVTTHLRHELRSRSLLNAHCAAAGGWLAGFKEVFGGFVINI
jgi:hypothetical protein